jgi:hypothetical protein
MAWLISSRGRTFFRLLAQVGETDSGRILVVISTLRDELIRVVTAFPAKTRLRTLYYAEKGSIYEGGTEGTEFQE